MELGDYRDLFVNEAQEYLNGLNQGTLKLEKNRQDIEAIHTIFRSAHTLKGMAATMGYDGITMLAHEFESALDQIRSGATEISQPMVDLLFEGIDELSKLIGEIAVGNEGGTANPGLLARVRQAATGSLVASQGEAAKPKVEATPAGADAMPQLPPLDAMRSHVISRQQAGAHVFQLRVSIDPKCAFKGVRAFLVLKNLEKTGSVLHTVPGAKELEEGKFEFVFDAWVESELGDEELKAACQKVLEIVGVEVALLPSPPGGLGLASTSSAQAAAPLAQGAQVAQVAPKAEAKPAAPMAAPKQTVRVNVERLDRIMNMVGELVTSKIRLAQIAKQKQIKELSDALIQVEHVVNELQEEAMAARMVPMEQVYSRFPRMIRDLSRELDKEVELVLEGSDIEMDRSILDEITEPLIHLLRNAMDHGLETAAERKQAGKPLVGLLRLEAHREKNMVVITVEDDGSGIRTDKVRAAAVRKGMMREDQARALSEEEAINLISLPGFSTVSTVTAVSGRGVGVDAVRTKVEGLGGSLRIESQPGKGSRFRVRLPLTLAIIQALMVRVGKEEYAAPVSNVVEVVELAPSELRVIHGQEVVMLRDEVLPVFRLQQLLEVPETSGKLPPLFSVLVVEAGENRAGLLVDEVVGQLEIAIKSLGRFTKGIRGFGGVTILGDGRICLILDFSSLMDL